MRNYCLLLLLLSTLTATALPIGVLSRWHVFFKLRYCNSIVINNEALHQSFVNEAAAIISDKAFNGGSFVRRTDFHKHTPIMYFYQAENDDMALYCRVTPMSREVDIDIFTKQKQYNRPAFMSYARTFFCASDGEHTTSYVSDPSEELLPDPPVGN
jgi:hypothetical protein